MYSGSGFLTNHRQLLDLPILSFLAPRVFQPWPTNVRKAHQRTARFDSSKKSRLYSSINRNKAYNSSYSTLVQPSSVARLDSRPCDTILATQYDSNASPSATNPTALPEYKKFRERYEEIWGDVREAGDSQGYSDAPISKTHENISKAQRSIVGQVLSTSVSKTRSRQSTTAFTIPIKVSEDNSGDNIIWRIPLGKDGSENFQFWKHRFSLVNSVRKATSRRDLQEEFQTPELKALSQKLHELLVHLPDGSLGARWQTIPVSTREMLWPHLMLLALDKYPNETLTLLTDTYQDPFPPDYAVYDIFNFIIEHHLSSPSTSESRTIAIHILNTLEYTFNHNRQGHCRLSQASISILLHHCPLEHVKRFYDLLISQNQQLNSLTASHIATKLLDAGEIDALFGALIVLRSRGGNFNTTSMQSLAASLLHDPGSSEKSHTEILAFFLENGMEVNLSIFNVTLWNFARIGDDATLWRTYDMMIESGLDADECTYSILLNRLKKTKNAASIQRLVSIIKDNDMWDRYTVSDLLHSIFLLWNPNSKTRDLSKYKGPAAVFTHMLQMYSEFFLLRPLLTIIPQLRESHPKIAGPRDDFPCDGGLQLAGSQKQRSELLGLDIKRTPIVYPSPHTLVIMLHGFFSTCTSSSQILTVYENFCSLVAQQHPDVAELMNTTYVYNAILLHLGRFSDALPSAILLVKQMLSPNSHNNNPKATSSITPNESHSKTSSQKTSASMEVQSEKLSVLAPSLRKTKFGSGWRPRVKSHIQVPLSYQKPRPDIHTWCILLKFFKDQRQMHAAEKVVKIMIAQGVKPSIVTWNTLICSYIDLQDPEMTIDAISRLEQDGHDSEEMIMRAASKLKNRRVFFQGMRGIHPSMRKARSGDIREQAVVDELNKMLGKVDGDYLAEDEDFGSEWIVDHQQEVPTRD